MPTADDRLTDALRAAGREPEVDDVLARVQAKRARRQTVRRAGVAAGAAAVIAAVAIGGSLVTDDGGSREVAVAPGPAVAPRVEVDGDRVEVSPVRTSEDVGYVRAPFVVADGTVTFASYDRAGTSYKIPPSHIVRMRLDGTVVDRVDLQGEILSVASGEGARWALTRDLEVAGPLDPAFRIKRIGPDGTVTSNAIAPGEQPAGDIVASGGAVWVPTRGGVLQVDPRSGQVVATLPLPPTDRRVVLSGSKFASVTAGDTLLRLDPSTSTTAPQGPVFGGEELIGAAGEDGSSWVLTGDGTVTAVSRDGRFLGLPMPLPAGLDAPTLGAAAHRAVVSGSSDGGMTVLVIAMGREVPEVERTIRIDADRDQTLTLLEEGDALLASGGRLYRIEVDR